MARTAVVTGGTRGLGRAAAIALKSAGCSFAVTYHGNDTAAHSFKTETGIAVYKWDVADFDACKAGMYIIEQDSGSVDVLVNNAGSTRDAPPH